MYVVTIHMEFLCISTFITLLIPPPLPPPPLSLSMQPGEGLYHKLMQHKQSIYMQISLLTSEYVYCLR